MYKINDVYANFKGNCNKFFHKRSKFYSNLYWIIYKIMPKSYLINIYQTE